MTLVDFFFTPSQTLIRFIFSFDLISDRGPILYYEYKIYIQMSW